MKPKDITIVRVTHLAGPNIWTYRPVIEAWLDIGAFEELPSNQLPGFASRLTQWLPGLVEHRCGVGEPGGFISRLDDGTWIGHVLEHVVLELQSLTGMQTGFGKTRQIAEGSGLYKMAFRTRDEQVGRRALALGRELVLAAVDDRAFDVAGAVAELTDLVDSQCLGPSTACIVDAATARGIPFIRLNDGNLVQLGYGSQQRRIWTAETERTSAIAESISGDKDLSKRLLASCGVPIPEGMVVDSPAAAWEAANDIGLPVVVKPVDGNHGRGVSLDLSTQADIEAAYALADAEGSEVMVEAFIRGDEHRLLVVGGKMVAAARGESAWICGDGQSTVRELIDVQLNTDPRRGLTEAFPLNRIELDEDAAVVLELTRQGLTADSIPPAGKRVLIQRNGNVALDCTDDVHPRVAATVALAARIVGLDIAGVDVVAEDISRPLEDQGGAIVEINAGPGLLMHLKPAAGQPRPVGQAIAAHLFAAGDSGRIPVIGIVDAHTNGTVARLLTHLLQLNGHAVGLSCADGLFFNGRCLQQHAAQSTTVAQRLLMNRQSTAAVFDTSAAAILQYGLPYDRCQIAVVTGLGSHAALDEWHIHTDEQLFDVLRTQIDVVLPDGVAILNAEDPRALALAALCDGDVILYALDDRQAALAQHRSAGKRVVVWHHYAIQFEQGGQIHTLETLPHHPLGLPSPAVMVPALAAAWAAGMSLDILQAGLQTFAAQAAVVPNAR